MRSPRAAARAAKPSFSIVSTTASPAAHARGLPPKVEPCLPGPSTAAASPRAMQAPIGTPLPSALAVVITSGAMPEKGGGSSPAYHAPHRQFPVCASSSISSQPRASQIPRNSAR